jgi:hypothetical protein
MYSAGSVTRGHTHSSVDGNVLKNGCQNVSGSDISMIRFTAASCICNATQAAGLGGGGGVNCSMAVDMYVHLFICLIVWAHWPLAAGHKLCAWTEYASRCYCRQQSCSQVASVFAHTGQVCRRGCCSHPPPPPPPLRQHNLCTPPNTC